MEKQSRTHHSKVINPKFKQFIKTAKNEKERKQYIRWVRREIKNPKKNVFIAEVNSKTIGYIIGKIYKERYTDKPLYSGYIEDLVVDEKYKQRGIASLLIKEFFKWLKNRKISYVGLNIFLNNKPALNLYKKFKFEEFSLQMKRKIK